MTFALRRMPLGTGAGCGRRRCVSWVTATPSLTYFSGREGHGLGLGAQKRDATNPLTQAAHPACPERRPTHPEGAGSEHCNLTVQVRWHHSAGDKAAGRFFSILFIHHTHLWFLVWQKCPETWNWKVMVLREALSLLFWSYCKVKVLEEVSTWKKE